jgi:HlyD family secretion protein
LRPNQGQKRERHRRRRLIGCSHSDYNERFTTGHCGVTQWGGSPAVRATQDVIFSGGFRVGDRGQVNILFFIELTSMFPSCWLKRSRRNGTSNWAAKLAPKIGFAVLLWFSMESVWAQPGKPPAAPAPVIVGSVVSREVSEQQSFVGSVSALRQVVVGSAVEGRVGEMLVNRGDKVQGPVDREATDGAKPTREPGQVLAQLETRTLNLQIDAAQTLLTLARDAAAELGEVLPREIELAEAKLEEARARVSFSEKDLERQNRLKAQNGVVSETEYEQAVTQHQVNLQLAAQSASDLARLRATRELRLRQVESRIRTAEQEIIRLEDLKTKYTLRAPFNGYVINKLTEVGAWVRPGDPIAEIVHLDSLEFEFTVPQQYLGDIQRSFESGASSLRARIEIEGLSESIEGQVDTIIPQADLRSRTLPVRAKIRNVEQGGLPLLRPGMIGRAYLAFGKKRAVLLVKKDALVLGGAKPVVFKLVQAGEKKTVVPVSVQAGTSLGSWIEVTGELSAGDQVVIQGNERLRPDQEVGVLKTSEETPPAL